jgi:hypothetical protein
MIRIVALFLVCAPALACNYPDEGNMPLRRAVAKVKYLPETESWAQSMHEAGAVVHYALHLDQPRLENGRCWWPVEVRAGGVLWRRFYVTPDAKALRGETAGPPPRAGR